MKPTQTAYDFIAREEGCRLKAYQDSVGVWTIGYGNTFYDDGQSVKKGDIINQEQAEILLKIIVDDFADKVSALITATINDNQFAALLSLAYNIGIGAFKRSTVLRKVNLNPSDPTIAAAFDMWKNAGGKPILLARRKREAKLYFS